MTMYAIDFRIRPPYKDFLNTGIFKGWDPTTPESIGCTSWWRMPIASQRHGSFEEFLRENDAAGIVKSVIMGRRTGDSGLGSGQIDNALVHELMVNYPDRFEGFCGIDPLEDGCLDDIRRCHAWGFKGVSVEPGWLNPNMYADDPRITPVYDLANELGMIVNITASAFVGPDISYTEPVNIQHVATAYPNMKIVVTHACWPNIDKILGVCLVCPNVYLAPDCYFYTRNMPFADQLVRAGNSWMRYRILFNSSYPVMGVGQAIDVWKHMGLDDEAICRHLFWNAKNLLGL